MMTAQGGGPCGCCTKCVPKIGVFVDTQGLACAPRCPCGRSRLLMLMGQTDRPSQAGARMFPGLE